MTIDLTPAELKALVHALNARIAVFNERLQEVGGRAEASWRLIRGYVQADCKLRDKLRAALADDDMVQAKLRGLQRRSTLPERD